MKIKKTGLYDIHIALGAKMVEFAGFLMPIQFTSIIEEHKRVREKVGIFDVSHMGEIEISGAKALDFVNYLTINDVSTLAVNQAQYTAMCYPEGGIVDDLLCYRRSNSYLLVVNASNTEKDYNWIIKNKIAGVEINNRSDEITQLAVQGKDAELILRELTDIMLSDIKYYWFIEGKLAGVSMIISRTGYTGEPGFELYFDRQYSEEVWTKIMQIGKTHEILPIGLGARDTLRLEKKYCLYGNDIDKATTPLEAGLSWITKLDKGNFIGRNSLLKQKEMGVTRKLMGFICKGKMIPRRGYPIEISESEIGKVTSGCYSPILDNNIGLGYIHKDYAKIGQRISLNARGRFVPAEIVQTPFL